MKLNAAFIKRIEPSDKDQFFRDDTVIGFGVKVAKLSGTKTYFVEKRVKGGKKHRVTICRVDELSLEVARDEARKLIGEAVRGIDPILARRQKYVQGITLRQALQDYLKVRKTLKPNTLRDYQRIFGLRENCTGYFADWLDLPMAQITKAMIQQRHSEIGQRSEAQANLGMRYLRAVFNFTLAQHEDAEGNSFLPNNPIQRLSTLRIWYKVDRRESVLNPGDMPVWYQAVHRLKVEKPTTQAEAVADLLLLLILTGLRLNEATSLAWSQVNLNTKIFTLLDTKNGKDLVLPMSDWVYQIFAFRYALCGEKTWVFPAYSRQGYMSNPYTLIHRISEETGVKFTPHDLRRTFRATCDRLSFPEPVSKRLLNHAVNLNDKQYFVPDIETLRGYTQKVADKLKEDMGFTEF